LLVLALSVSCERRVADYAVPTHALRTRFGIEYVVVRPGDGEPATAGGIWGVEEKLVSHSVPGCPYPCTRCMLRPVADPYHNEYREWLLTIREGEIRRVWLVGADGKTRVFEFKLASVVKTDTAGNPVYVNRNPNLGKPQPYEREAGS